MDNITHSLIGGLIGRATVGWARKRGPVEPVKERAIYWTAVLASSAPDLDFLPMALKRASQLEYLLDHRGYTHTLLLSPVMAALGVLIGGLLAGQKAWALRDRATLRLLFVVGWVAVLLHMGADSWNEYGVHPFSPFSGRWHYGDFIFIAEPLIWLALLPWVFFEAHSRVLRFIVAGVIAAVVVLLLSGKFMSMGVGAGVVVIGVALAFFQWRKPSWSRAAALLVGLLAVFSLGSSFAKSKVEAAIRAISPGERIAQLSASPSPGNPFCWRVLSAGVAPDGHGSERYVARLGGVNLVPSLFAANDCPARQQSAHYAPLEPVRGQPIPGIAWVGEFSRPLSELRNLSKLSCSFGSLLEFARMPFWIGEVGGLMAGDLRYDRGPERGSFAVFAFTREDDKECLRRRGWEEPVHELLAGAVSRPIP